MRRPMVLGCLVGILLFGVRTASAAAIGLTEASLGPVLIDFGLTQTFAPINGVTIGGVLFNFSIANVASNDAVIDSGPGVTNHVSPANIEGNAFGVLSLTFPGLETRFGFGYAIGTTGPVANAAHVDLFDGSNALVGSLSFNGVSDPAFTGGFAGLGSTTPFARAEVTFNTAGGRFAFDNVRFDSQAVDAAAVPEPSAILLVLTGLAALAVRRQTRL